VVIRLFYSFGLNYKANTDIEGYKAHVLKGYIKGVDYIDLHGYIKKLICLYHKD